MAVHSPSTFSCVLPGCFTSSTLNLSIIQSSIFNISLPLAPFPANLSFHATPPFRSCSMKPYFLRLIMVKKLSCCSQHFQSYLNRTIFLFMISSSPFSRTTILPLQACFPYSCLLSTTCPRQ